jgi:hypothetical protein
VEGDIMRCYSSGPVSGQLIAGGLVGSNSTRASITSSFWDNQTSGQKSSAGGTGLPTSNMTLRSTYEDVGWDFENVWIIANGSSYPFFYGMVGDDMMIITGDVIDAYDNVSYYVDYDVYDPSPKVSQTNWTIGTNATWLNINVTEGIISGIPTNGDIGTYWVDVFVERGIGRTDHTNFTLTVHNINDPPVLSLDHPEIAKEDEEFVITYEFYDPDPSPDIVNVSFETNIDWLSIDQLNRTIEGTPENGDEGYVWVNVIATDEEGASSSVNTSFTVLPVNDDPVITSTEFPDLIEDEPFWFDLEVSDIDSDLKNMKWSINDSSVGFFQIDQRTGNLSGTPENQDVGEHWIIVDVFDEKGAMDSINISFSVMNVNDDPVIVSEKYLKCDEEKEFSYDLVGYDIDPTDDILTWSLETPLGFLNLDEVNNRIYGSPDDEDVGVSWALIILEDGNGGIDSVNITFNVRGVNDPPSTTIESLDCVIYEDHPGYYLDISGLFTDPDDEYLSMSFIEMENITGKIQENDTILLIPNKNWFGTSMLTLIASDGSLSDDLNISIQVFSINDPPEIIEVNYTSIVFEGGDQWVSAHIVDVDLPYGDILTYQWSTNSTGPLGTGETFNLSLSKGVYLLMLNVSDEGGAYDVWQSSITVLPKDDIIPVDDDDIDDDDDVQPPHGPKDKDNGIPLWVWIIIVIAVFVILLGIVVFFISRKKKNDQVTHNVEQNEEAKSEDVISIDHSLDSEETINEEETISTIEEENKDAYDKLYGNLPEIPDIANEDLPVENEILEQESSIDEVLLNDLPIEETMDDPLKIVDEEPS